MRALVVYESMFGNTRAVAEAIGVGMSAAIETDVLEVSDAPAEVPEDVVLLVAGGPTHAFGLSSRNSRQSARKQGADGSVDTGLRDWLQALAPPRTVSAATFCTRIARPRVPGSAARSARKALHGKGVDAIAAEDFWVRGTPGPLRDGEIERARRWGHELASRVAAPTG